MTAPSRSRKLRATAVVLVLMAVLVSIALCYPKQVADPVLGGGWRCSRTAFVTSCTRTAPAQQSLRTSPILFRPV
jgi:hypothetical protein